MLNNPGIALFAEKQGACGKLRGIDKVFVLLFIHAHNSRNRLFARQTKTARSSEASTRWSYDSRIPKIQGAPFFIEHKKEAPVASSEALMWIFKINIVNFPELPLITANRR